MVYYDYSQNRYVCSTPTLIPDIRAHLANWRQFRKVTSVWPFLAMSTFFMRFVIMIAAMAATLWYGVVHRDWTKGEYLASFALLIPILILWFLIERLAWNHDLRRMGIASNSDVWGVDQFPKH